MVMRGVLLSWVVVAGAQAQPASGAVSPTGGLPAESVMRLDEFEKAVGKIDRLPVVRSPVGSAYSVGTKFVEYDKGTTQLTAATTRLSSDFSGEEKMALRAYFEDRVASLKKPQPYYLGATKALSLKDVQAYQASLGSIYRDVVRLSSIQLDLVIASQPDGARCTLHPSRYPQGAKTKSTEASFQNLYPGSYDARLQKSGFQQCEVHIDLIDDRPNKVICPLHPDAGTAEPCTCSTERSNE